MPKDNSETRTTGGTLLVEAIDEARRVTEETRVSAATMTDVTAVIVTIPIDGTAKAIMTDTGTIDAIETIEEMIDETIGGMIVEMTTKEIAGIAAEVTGGMTDVVTTAMMIAIVIERSKGNRMMGMTMTAKVRMRHTSRR
jgi:hypothetical protein